MPKAFTLRVVLVALFGLLVGAPVAAASLGPGEAPEYAPAGSEAYTIDLEIDGYRNGRMDPDRMMTVRGCTLERDAAYLFSLMLDAADEDGIDLGFKDCYRSYDEQRSAYERRCPWVETPIFETDPDTGEMVQSAVNRVRVCSGPPVAPAGASNHGWGRAVDFADGWNRSVLTCYDAEFHWLKLNAHRFGWIHPAWAHCGRDTQEPWHWEFAGVTDPTLVAYVAIDPTLVPALE